MCHHHLPMFELWHQNLQHFRPLYVVVAVDAAMSVVVIVAVVVDATSCGSVAMWLQAQALAAAVVVDVASSVAAIVALWICFSVDLWLCGFWLRLWRRPCLQLSLAVAVALVVTVVWL